MLTDLLAYYKMVREKNINIIYSGPIWADGIEGLAGTLRKRLEFDDLSLSAAQAVFSVFVEQMNNMLMYASDRERRSDFAETPTGVFVLGCRGKQYFLQSGNLMKKSSVPYMREKIDHLNTLDKNELRQYYKEQIKSENTNPESKGAGLGLIEIARRTSSKIEYDFEPYGDEQTFFSMYVTIG